MKLRIGALTIGQSPRKDLTEEIRRMLAGKAQLVEAGALDNLSPSQIRELYPVEGENLLVTRLADGKGVRVAENRLLPLLQDGIDHLDEAGCATTLLLCTGNFRGLQSKALLVKMDEILQATVRAVAENHRLGVICPQADQFGWMRARWEQVSAQVTLTALDPHADEKECLQVALDMKDRQVELAVMDCMGYSVQMQQFVREASGLPVVLARGITLGILKEMYNF